MNDNPPARFYFALQLDGAGGPIDASFQEASGIGSEMETETIREGSENRFVHSLPKGVKHPALVLKRGIAGVQSGVVTWCQATLEGGLSQPVETKVVTLSLLDQAGGPLRIWSLQNAYPVQWAVEPFQADKKALAIEKLQLAYSALQRTL